MLRKIRRDNLRKKVSGKNLRSAWTKYQMKKYEEDYRKICFYGGRK